MSALTDQIERDKATFLNVDEWALAATYRENGSGQAYETSAQYETETPYAGTSAAEINVLFDEHSEVVDPQNVDVLTTAPTALAATSDVPNAGRNDTLVVDGVTYYVMHAIEDGDGYTLLILSRHAV